MNTVIYYVLHVRLAITQSEFARPLLSESSKEYGQTMETYKNLHSLRPKLHARKYVGLFTSECNPPNYSHKKRSEITITATSIITVVKAIKITSLSQTI